VAVPEKEVVGEEDTDQWGLVVSRGGKKRKEKKMRKERGAGCWAGSLGRCLAGPRAWPSWGATRFFFVLFLFLISVSFLFYSLID
jgi:hypothetical protein